MRVARTQKIVNDGNPPAPEDLEVTVEVRVVVTTVVDGAFQVLLRQRTVPPFLDSWELPGGPLQPGVGLEDTAKRELAKAAPTYNEDPVGSRRYHLEQFGAYGDPDPIPEDAPERVVSIGYWAIVPSLPDTAMGDDVTSHKLFRVAEVDAGQAREFDEVRLAFNHRQILADAIEWARDRLENTTIAASFCGPEFTISELRGVYDAVWGTKLDPGNFQRKVKQTDGFLEPVNQTTRTSDKGGRPAALWVRGPAEKLSPPLSRPHHP